MDNQKLNTDTKNADKPELHGLPCWAGVLETIINEIKEHDEKHPTHGIGCACMDTHAGTLRKLFDEHGLYDRHESGYVGSTKSLRNLHVVLGYLIR